VFKSKSTFFITLNIGGEPRHVRGRLISERSATLADIEFGSEAVEDFCNAMLRDLYGHHWMKRKDIRFSVLAVPETRSKEGHTVPLHFHIMFDGTGLSNENANEFKKRVSTVWSKIAERRFGHVPSFKTLRSREIKKLTAYVTKWLEPRSPHESAMILKSESECFRRGARPAKRALLALSQFFAA
jgi:hypothetical protein